MVIRAHYQEQRAAVRQLLLQGGRGRAMRYQPEVDPEGHFAHALPAVCWVDVLECVGRGWFGRPAATVPVLGRKRKRS